MHAMTLRYHANVSRHFGASIRKLIANSSHPSEIGTLAKQLAKTLITLEPHGIF